MRLSAFLAGVLLVLCATAGCGSPGSSSPEANAPRIVAVTIMLPDPAPAALPADATLDIRVVEVSGPDRAVVGSLQPGQPPPRAGVEYKVECTASRIRDSQSYGLEVAIVSGGKVILRNKKPYYVLTRGNPDRVQVEVQP